MRTWRLVAVALFCSFVFSSLCIAQATGSYAFGPFDNHGFDAINRGNLDIHFSIPIFSKPGRGGSNFAYYLNYDGLVWSPTASVWTPATEFGWTDTTNAEYGYVTYRLSAIICGYTYQGKIKIPEYATRYSDYIYHDNHGNTHAIPYSFTGPCGGTIGTQTGTATYTMTDNSGLTIYRDGGAFVVVTAQGAEFSVPEYMQENTSSPYYTQSNPGSAVFTDTNGNEISASSTGVFTDTMGKTVLTVSGSAPNPVVYTYTDSNGQSRTVTVNYTEYTVQTHFGVSGITEYNQSNIPLVSSIVYSADNTSYSFTYEKTPGNSSAVTGRIASITLRTGGTISYTYTGGNNGIEADGTTAGLTRTTSDGTTTYVRSSISSTASTTTTTDAMGNQAVSTFLISPGGYFYESDNATYAGTAGGTALQEVQTCYNSTVCSSSNVSSNFSSIVQYIYKNGTLVDTHTQSFGSSELLNSDDDTASDADTSYTYNQYTDSDGVPFYRLTSATTATAQSQNYMKTTYGYDEGALTTTSGLPQHVSVSTPRGNLTSIHQWYDSSGNMLTTAMTYDDAGQVLSQTAPDGGVTSYTYDSATDTLPTKVTLPSVHGNRYSASFTFDANTGLMVSSTDLNGQTTTYSYDGMLRPGQFSYPDGGKTVYNYYPTQDQIGVLRYQTASTYEDTETLYDGYGRVSRVAVANGQGSNPWYQTDTCYNADGEVGFQSYRYQGNGWSTSKVCSGAGDAYTYDSLGRATKITHGDGTSVNYAYETTATEVTDENGVKKIINMLAPSRIAAVCEISSNSSMPGSGSPASCNMPISGTGFLTNYAYNLPSHEVTVSQGAQTRVFETDWAGRPTYIQQPESGTTTYSYAFNGTGLVVTRERPKANQTNSSVLTTTTTQYDALDRPITVSYSDGTPTKNLTYDTGAGWTNFTQTNLIGRLSMAIAVNSSGAWTGGNTFSYDSMGRVSELAECVPSECGNPAYDKHLPYTYDWTGDVLSAGDGNNVTTSYTWSPAAQLLGMTSSQSGSGYPSNLISNVKEGPFGPISYTLGNGLNVDRTYDTLGRVNAQWVCNGPAAQNCSGGTQLYGFALYTTGDQVHSSCDTIMANCTTYGYDEFDRVKSLTINSGYSGTSFTYTYDRYGNRWAQNVVSGSGPAPSFSFNTSNNQINSSGYTYDAAGNMTSDGMHTYTYDADGNMTEVDGGSSDVYTYNALNQRVRIDWSGGGQFLVFGLNDQRTTTWNTSDGSIYEGVAYWGGTPIEYYDNGYAHFESLDWTGTKRMSTNNSGAVEGKYGTYLFGDDLTVLSGSDYDGNKFAGMDGDNPGDMSHAKYRQYSNTRGQWYSPDPYLGSYDPSNPQSMNRYTYVLNNPLAYVDPDGTTGGCPYAIHAVGQPLFGSAPCPPDPCNGLGSCSGGNGSGNGPTGGSGGQPAQGSGGQQNAGNQNKPESPARKACEDNAKATYANAQMAAINNIHHVIARDFIIGEGATAAFGCAVGLLPGGVFGSIPGAGVGCGVGAATAAFSAVPATAIGGGIDAYLTYESQMADATNAYNAKLSACSLIP
jgi:RHS repeat-associated protein